MNRNRHEHHGAHESRRDHKKLWTVLAIVFALLIVLVTVYAIWERPPELEQEPGKTPPPAAETQKPAPDAQTGTEDPTGSTGKDDEPEPEDPADDYTNALVTDRAPGTYTFLIVGRDHASNSTDTIIVGRMDTREHTINCVSIPRDTLINIGWATTPKKINAVYPGYINSGKNGIDGLKTQIANLLGFEVDCYAVVSIRAMEQAVDAIGGVWFDVPVDMHYEDPMQDLYIDIDKGYQLLNGENAVKVCRFRDTYTGGDIDRINVQQDFMKTLASQILTLGNIPNLGTLVDILASNLDTDLTAANIAWFARQFLICSMKNISFQTMPWSEGCAINGISYVSVDVNAWLDMVNEKLNPYTEPVTVGNMNLLTSNYSGTYMNATNGAVAGGPDSFYCIMCTVKNNGVATYHLPTMCPPDEE